MIAVHHDAARCAAGRGRRAAHRAAADRLGPRLAAAAVLRCLRWLRERADFDWLVLLSGQDYPVRPVAGDRGRGCTAPTPSSRPRPSRRGHVAPRRGRTSSRAATGCAGARSRPRVAARGRTADPLAHVRTLPRGTYLGLPRAAAAAAVPRLGLVHALAHAPSTRVLAAPRDVLDHFLHTIVPTEAFVADRAGQLAAAAGRRQPPLRALRARLGQPAGPGLRRPRRRARLRRRLRAQVRRSGRAGRARPAPNLMRRDDGLDPVPDARPARLPRGRAGLGRAAGARSTARRS